MVELVVLAAVAREHLLVIGPPGTAKSAALRAVAGQFEGAYFEYLVGKFTEPSELFGPVDLRRLKEGVVETQTAGMLPEAQIAFLDEVFLGSTAILNTLLTLLNERTFRRGDTNMACPLRVCVGASNRLPEEPQLAAFADRFLVRAFVAATPDAGLEDLLAAGASSWATRESLGGSAASMMDLDVLGNAARAMDLAGVRPVLADCIRRLRHEGIALSDRRLVRVQRLVASAAVLGGRGEATRADLWPLVFAVPTEAEQHTARTVLRDVLGETHNSTLLYAPAEGSLGRLAQVPRIVRDVAAALALPPRDAASLFARQLRLEGLAREIDAGFDANALPADLSAVRTQLVQALASTAS